MSEADEVNVVVIDPDDPDCLEQLADALAGIVREAILLALESAVERGADAEDLALFTQQFCEKASTGWGMPAH